MEKKIVYVDMDGVIVDFGSAAKALPPDSPYLENPDLCPGIFAGMKPMPGAVDAVRKLCEWFDVYILSTAPWDNPSAWSDKLVWLKRWFGEGGDSPMYKRLILSHRKDLLKGDYLIDDRPFRKGTVRFGGTIVHFGGEVLRDWDDVMAFMESENKKQENEIMKM